MQVTLKLDKRQAILVTAILGSSFSEEVYEVYEELYTKLTQEQLELVDELSYHLINVNINESELLDEVEEAYLVRKLGE